MILSTQEMQGEAIRQLVRDQRSWRSWRHGSIVRQRKQVGGVSPQRGRVCDTDHSEGRQPELARQKKIVKSDHPIDRPRGYAAAIG